MTRSNFESYCTHKLSGLRPNSTFLTVKNYVNNFDELTDFSVGFHISYVNAVSRSLKILEKFIPTFRFCQDKPFSIRDLVTAQQELLESLRDSLNGYNYRYTCHGVYEALKDATGKIIPGAKLHLNQDVLHLEGYRLQKRIYRLGQYPEDTRLPITKAKDALRDLLPAGKWGQWKLTPSKFEKFLVEKVTVTNQEIFRLD